MYSRLSIDVVPDVADVAVTYLKTSKRIKVTVYLQKCLVSNELARPV